MATTVTVTKPATIQTVHARPTTGHYHRFETNVNAINLEDPNNDNAAFNGTSITFPAGITQIHVLLTNSHYYRFESSGQVTTLQNGDVTGSFTTISFATS